MLDELLDHENITKIPPKLKQYSATFKRDKTDSLKDSYKDELRKLGNSKKISIMEKIKYRQKKEEEKKRKMLFNTLHKEITKYLKEKRIENKKEEENTEKEKQLKAYVTFKNLVKLGKKWENNINLTKIEHKITQKKSRKESKEHLKLRKEPNEYYIGTESSKNNSTFIDKKEYYISILESKNFVNQTKVSKHEDEKETENNNNKISIDIGGNDILNNSSPLR